MTVDRSLAATANIVGSVHTDMSTEQPSDGPVARFVDTVTPAYVGRPNSEMHAIGLLLAGLLLVALFPLLPFVALVWVIARLSGGRTERRSRFDRSRGRTPPS